MEENIVEIIEDILNNEWIEDNAICGDDAICGKTLCGYENALDVKPQILRQWNPKRVNLAKEDAVILYETSQFAKEPGDITYHTENVTGFVSVDIRTVNSEARFKALYTQIEAIRKMMRKAPHTDYDRWDFIRETLFHRPLSWRAVIDYKLSKANITL